MKQLLFFFLIVTHSAIAQNFSLVDEKVKTYPKLLSAQKLADNITSDFSSETEKVRAIYTWLTCNIRYDLAEYYNPTQTSFSFSYSTIEEKLKKIKALDNKIVSETLSSRKAVCEGYARVFAKVCNLLYIENVFISGYARNSSNEIGKPLPNPNHAWNAVKINGVWKYFDATWGAGYEENGKWKHNFNDYYFDIPKKKLFLTHFPEDTLWQLRVKRMNKKDFYNQPIYKSYFLNSNLELTTVSNGKLKINSEGFIHFKIKNLNSTKKIYFGFDNLKFIKKPIIATEKNIIFIKIMPPKNSKEAYLFIDGMLALEFLIE